MPLLTFCIVLGVVELLFAMPPLVRPQRTAQWFLDLKKDSTIVRVVTALFLIIGVLVLTRDTSIGFDLAGLVRLFAWVICIKSLIICWWPQKHAYLADKFLTGSLTQYLVGVWPCRVGANLPVGDCDAVTRQ